MMSSAVWFGLSVLTCCSLAGPVGHLLGVIDYPGGRKTHEDPTPLVGGIALMVPLVLVAVAEAVWREQGNGVFTSLAICGLGFLILGWYDDRHHAPPVTRLIIACGLFGALLLLQPELVLIELYLDPGLPVLPLVFLAFPFTLICLVGLQNAINMIDGLNGLLIGLAIFWIVCLRFYAPPDLSLFLTFFLLGLAILLPYNLAGWLFLGDAGSYSIGAMVGVMMIHVWHEANGALPMSTVVLWLSVPVMDCLRVMGMRLWRASSPLLADRNHLHHRLARRWPWPACLVVYLGLAAVPGLIAAVEPDLTPQMLLLVVAAYSTVLWVTRKPHGRSWSERPGSPTMQEGPRQAR
jgi:UDP-GlcNAc:undecaprenyl-phosphate/decaprenyl-phosphate GlcNAc-1-phosphate transferase